MTEEQLDRRVGDADPWSPEIVDRLGGAQHALLEEIMSESSAAPRAMVRQFAGALAAAAVLVVVLAAAAVMHGRGHATPGTAPPTSGAPLAYFPVALQAAEDNPRLLIQQPGWTITTVYGFTERKGTIAYADSGRRLEINWYPADQYPGYYDDRRKVSAPQPATVDGWAGSLFRYGPTDFAIMLKPRDGVFAELRAGGGDRTDVDRLMTYVNRVDVPTFLAAMPPEIVTPAKAGAAAAKVLAGVPLPPGFEVSSMDIVGTNDPYQFGAQVTGRVGCAWIAEWLRAGTAGDATAAKRAADALESSHEWKVLNDMTATGGWPAVFWNIADQIAAGRVPVSYQDSLGCG